MSAEIESEALSAVLSYSWNVYNSNRADCQAISPYLSTVDNALALQLRTTAQECISLGNNPE